MVNLALAAELTGAWGAVFSAVSLGAPVALLAAFFWEPARGFEGNSIAVAILYAVFAVVVVMVIDSVIEATQKNNEGEFTAPFQLPAPTGWMSTGSRTRSELESICRWPKRPLGYHVLVPRWPLRKMALYGSENSIVASPTTPPFVRTPSLLAFGRSVRTSVGPRRSPTG